VFDKVPRKAPAPGLSGGRAAEAPEDERIALRCHRKELQLVDSFVASGEFESRSDLMRQALREFLRTRAMSAIEPAPGLATGGLREVPVRLRQDEVETYATFGQLVENGQDLCDVLAALVRRGGREAKVQELVQDARESMHRELVQRERLDGLKRSAQDLERKGVVGR
jgi:Arc/MetJ-type ribon-helix-helix transcriptional regulator